MLSVYSQGLLLLQLVERNGRLCGCTQRGCLEAYSSATALVTQAQKQLDAGSVPVPPSFYLQWLINAML